MKKRYWFATVTEEGVVVLVPKNNGTVVIEPARGVWYYSGKVGGEYKFGEHSEPDWAEFPSPGFIIGVFQDDQDNDKETARQMKIASELIASAKEHWIRDHAEKAVMDPTEVRPKLRGTENPGEMVYCQVEGVSPSELWEREHPRRIPSTRRVC
jgi:hypothetical protein